MSDQQGKVRVRQGRTPDRVQVQALLTQVQVATIGAIANRPPIAAHLPRTGIRTADRRRPHYGRHHHHGRHHRWPMPPMPGSEFFEAMMNFAASAAGSRGRWWQGMADAARYARKDYSVLRPLLRPLRPISYYCDPCALPVLLRSLRAAPPCAPPGLIAIPASRNTGATAFERSRIDQPQATQRDAR